jgi:Sensors of blue-light using FAD.
VAPLHVLVYQSQATRPMEAGDLDQLLLDARVANELAEVTGALLYGDQRFFQYLEGARADVEQIYARIARASQHHRLEILEQGRVDKRLFQRWHMGFANAPQTLVQQLSQSQWKREMPWLEDEAASSPGLARLLAFWKDEAVPTR